MAFAEIGISLVKGMTINTMSFTSVHGREAITSHLVFSVVHNLKVSRIHAPSYTAQVVTLIRRGWNVLHEHFVHQTMGLYRSLVKANTCIAAGVERGCPKPTGTALIGHGRVNLNLAEQLADQGKVSTVRYLKILTSVFESFSIDALNARVTQAVRSGVSGVKFFGGLLNAALVTNLSDRIGKGHRCLQLGNLT